MESSGKMRQSDQETLELILWQSSVVRLRDIERKKRQKVWYKVERLFLKSKANCKGREKEINTLKNRKRK